MASAPAPWQLTLARIEGALPFISPELSECLALASLRRLWRVHVRDYPFDNLGIEHNPGLEADELVRQRREARAARGRGLGQWWSLRWS